MFQKYLQPLKSPENAGLVDWPGADTANKYLVD